MTTITIKCPHCGSVLKVPNQPGIETAIVMCSNCKEKSKFADCPKVILKPKQTDSDATQYGPNAFKSGDDDHTVTPADLNRASNQPIGKLVLISSGAVFQLKMGNNTIGRQASNSTASIQIPDITQKRQMSRQHAIIDVVCMADGNIRHTLRNWKNKNRTLVGGTEVTEADRIVLINGQLIRMGDIDMRFTV